MKNKSILYIIILLINSSIISYAQLQVYDVKDNYNNHSNVKGYELGFKILGGISKNFTNTTSYTETIPAYAFGGTLGYIFENRLGAELNLEFSRKGSNNTFYIDNGNNGYRVPQSYNLHLYYLDIAPVMTYNIGDFQFYAGPFLGICLFSYQDVSGTVKFGDHVKTIDFGTYYGARYRLFDFLKLDLNLNYGFNNINNYSLFNEDKYMRNISYRIGIILNF